jgi:transposase
MQTVLNIGADIGKDAVMLACAEASFAPRSIANRRSALLGWLRSLPAGSRIALEATGRYHELLAHLAHQRGLEVFVLNPRDLRHYARAVGLRGKTDRVDAQLIARFIAHEHAKLHAHVPASPAQRALERLLKRRAKLTTIKGALRLTLQGVPGLGAEGKALLTRLQGLLDKIDSHLETLSRQQPQHEALRQRLQTILGVGPLVSTALASTLQRLPFRNGDAVVAHTGLDPRPADSGRKIGRRRLSKRGPSELRRLLFNAAMSAAKTKLWRPIYQHYRNKGLSSTAALVVIARKIVRIAWSLFKNQTVFDPTRLARA